MTHTHTYAHACTQTHIHTQKAFDLVDHKILLSKLFVYLYNLNSLSFSVHTLKIEYNVSLFVVPTLLKELLHMVYQKGQSWVIASIAVSNNGIDDRIAVMIWSVSVNHFRRPRDVTPVWKMSNAINGCAYLCLQYSNDWLLDERSKWGPNAAILEY